VPGVVAQLEALVGEPPADDGRGASQLSVSLRFALQSANGRPGKTDPAKREAMLHHIQKLLHERTRFAPIFDYFWPSGLGPRVEEASLMKIDPFPWSAPLEDVRLKQP